MDRSFAAPPLTFAWRWPSPGRWRIALLAVLVGVPLLVGGWLLLRKSPFVSVQHVHVSGVHGAQAGAIEEALVNAAHHMSTLDVNRGALSSAVAGYPVVRRVIATPRFPHGLDIRVIEQPPVAALVVGTSRTAVAADGVVLGSTLASSSLPVIGGYRELQVGQHVDDTGLREILSVLGAAPAPMRRAIARAYTTPRGLTLAMRNGLLAYFGDATRPHAKWLSLDSVLADSSSRGASYVDVRDPGPSGGWVPGGRHAAGSEHLGILGSRTSRGHHGNDGGVDRGEPRSQQQRHRFDHSERDGKRAGNLHDHDGNAVGKRGCADVHAIGRGNRILRSD